MICDTLPPMRTQHVLIYVSRVGVFAAAMLAPTWGMESTWGMEFIKDSRHGLLMSLLVWYIYTGSENGGRRSKRVSTAFAAA